MVDFIFKKYNHFSTYNLIVKSSVFCNKIFDLDKINIPLYIYDNKKKILKKIQGVYIIIYLGDQMSTKYLKPSWKPKTLKLYF